MDPQRLIDLRERAGLTQQQLADRCTELGWPITQTAITKLERGVSRCPWVQTLDVIAEALTEELKTAVLRADLLVKGAA